MTAYPRPGILGPQRGSIAQYGLSVARAAFWVVVVLAPFRLAVSTSSREVPGVSHDYSDLRLLTVQLAMAVLLCAWLVSLAAARRRPRRPAGSVAATGLALLGLIWIGVGPSIDPVLSLGRALDVTAFAGLALYVASEVRTPRDLALPAIVMMAVQSVVAIAQVLHQGSLGLVALGEQVLDPRVRSISVVASLDGVRFLRAYGLTDHPNILGGILAMGLLATLGGLSRAGRGLPRLGVTLVIAAAVLALALTFSRGAWIALVVGALVAATLMARSSGLRAARPWLLLAGALPIALVALAVPLGPYLFARLDPEADRPAIETRSYDERIVVASAALKAVGRHPLLGTGIGTLPQALSADPSLGYPPQAAHLVPLEIAAEDGLPAAGAYCLFIVAAFVSALTKTLRGGPEFAPLAMAGGLLIAITIAGLLDHYPWTSPAGLAWLAIAIGTCVGGLRSPFPVTERSGPIALLAA
jgi:hypothetical protein